ncbi:MAG: ATP-dependent RNA helicase HrpA [Neisseriaceae bacterium]
MNFNQVLAKDLFLLGSMQKDSRYCGQSEKIKQVYESSHRAYLRRLKNRPIPTFSNDLPVLEKHELIRNTIEANQVVIICGETGSGKTTQLPKICLELDRGVAGLIGHTQPRRIAAKAVANRLSTELDCELGKQVGYKVRFQDKTNSDTYIKVLTDGMLLAELQNDRYLRAYDTLIIDEAHERSLNIDFLLGYLKKLILTRSDLKLIITSATLNVEIFSRHFNDAPIINVSGRTYPINLIYRPLEAKDEDEIDISLGQAVLEAIQALWTPERSGDILVFFPGEREIWETRDLLIKQTWARNAEILPLYARLPSAEQQKIFKPGSVPRVILSTNVAETSLTVPGIKYVVDTGLARIKRYSTRTKVEQLKIEKISQAAAQQRAGRCGRISEGTCIRLFSEQDYLSRAKFTDAEILRSNLAHVILTLLSLPLGSIESFSFLEKPAQRLVNNGLQDLYELGAIDKYKALTNLGKRMAQLPVDPRFARIILASDSYNCVSEILVIISALSIEDPREYPFESKEAAKAAHAKFADPRSDFIGSLQLWNAFQHKINEKTSNRELLAWAKQHFLSYHRMREWKEVFTQLKEIVERWGLSVSRNNLLEITDMSISQHRYNAIHKALLTGLATKVGLKSPADDVYMGTRGSRFQIFPSSSLSKKKPKWVVAAELVSTSRVYARNLASIEPTWIEKETPHLVKYHHTNPRWSKKRGETVVDEKVIMCGLTIVTGRMVSCSKVNKELAREIFIREGLIAGQIDLSASFYLNNKIVVEKVEEVEHKARKRSIFLEEVLFTFYDQKLPTEVINLLTLRTWLSENSQVRNEMLSLHFEEIISQTKQHQVEAQFPSSIRLGINELTLLYRFEPGHPMDGVTLQLPLQLLNQVNAKQLEWLVPGMIREKLQYLIKALPKAIRKYCVPIPQFLTEFLASKLDFAAPIHLQLAKAIGRKIGDINQLEAIKSVWCDYTLPMYCYMNIQVLDEHGVELGMGRDIYQLRRELAEKVSRAFCSEEFTADLVDRENYWEQWTQGGLPIEVNFSRARERVVGYPALHEDNGKVGIRLFETALAAEQAHRKGLLKLIQTFLKRQLKGILEDLANLDQIVLLLGGLYSTSLLRQEILEAVIQKIFLTVNLPRSEVELKKQLKLDKIKLSSAILEIKQYLLQVVVEFHGLKAQLNSHPLQKTVLQQLNRLIYQGFILETPWEIWPRLPLYLKAIRIRLQQYFRNPTRDEEGEKRLEILETRLFKRMELARLEGAVLTQAWTAYRWQLEELRLAQFAQAIRPAQKVSFKQLDKQWLELSKIH